MKAATFWSDGFTSTTISLDIVVSLPNLLISLPMPSNSHKVYGTIPSSNSCWSFVFLVVL